MINKESKLGFYQIEKLQGPKGCRTEWNYEGNVLLVFEDMTFEVNTTVKCKVHLGPRYFEKLYVRDVQDIRLYYFSHETGGRLMKPVITENNGSFVIDAKQNVEYAIDFANKNEMSADERAELELLQDILLKSEGWHYRKVLGEKGWYQETESWSDWSTTHYKVWFKRNSFSIENHEIQSLFVDCHMTTDQEEETFRLLSKPSDWSIEELYQLVLKADKYDWKLTCKYYDSNDVLHSSTIRFNGGNLRVWSDRELNCTLEDGMSVRELISKIFE